MDELLLEKLNFASDASWVVARALALIDKPMRWTKFAWALDSRGQWVDVTDQSASRFCLVGAVLRAEHELHGREIAYGESASSGARAPVPAASGRLALVLDFLSLQVQEVLEASGVPVRLVREVDLGLIDDNRVIRSHDLPVIYNGMKGVGHTEVFGVLMHAGQMLLEVAQSPELAGELVAERRLRLPAKQDGAE
jgi:hypothetical protein